jgi:hypothetical protein
MIGRFGEEVQLITEQLVLPTWGGPLHGLPNTLYGLMMRAFSYIDLLSAYWRGADNEQSRRMVDFMECYLGIAREASSVAVQMWRHKLMHTAAPRNLTDRAHHMTYTWLLHWGPDHLPREQHFTFSDAQQSRVLAVGLAYLVEDLGRAMQAYLADVRTSEALHAKMERFERKLAASELREL